MTNGGNVVRAILLAAVWVVGAAAAGDDAAALVAAITGPDADARVDASRNAGPVGAAGVPILTDCLAAADYDVAAAARGALASIVHYAARPGGDPGAARTVAQALLELAAPSYPLATRQEALYLLPLIADDACVPSVAALVVDKELGEDACTALEQMPGQAAAKALVDALASTEGPLRLHVAAAIGRKGVEEAIPKLRELALGRNRDLSWACLDALARMGVPPTAVFARNPAFSTEDTTRYCMAAFTGAYALAAKGDKRTAEGTFKAFTDLRTPRHLVCAALIGLADLQSEDFCTLALGYLDDPEVREVGIQTLIKASGPGIEEKLDRAYDVVEPLKRTAILQVLGARKAPGIEKLLETAMQDGNVEVRVTAAQLAGRPPTEDDLLRVATQGSSWARDGACSAYFETARAKKDAGETDGARAMFDTIVRSAFPAEYQTKAAKCIEELTPKQPEGQTESPDSQQEKP